MNATAFGQSKVVGEVPEVDAAVHPALVLCMPPAGPFCPIVLVDALEVVAGLGGYAWTMNWVAGEPHLPIFEASLLAGVADLVVIEIGLVGVRKVRAVVTCGVDAVPVWIVEHDLTAALRVTGGTDAGVSVAAVFRRPRFAAAVHALIVLRADIPILASPWLRDRRAADLRVAGVGRAGILIVTEEGGATFAGPLTTRVVQRA